MSSNPQPTTHNLQPPSAWIVPTVFWTYIMLLVAGFALFCSPLARPEGGKTSMSFERVTFFTSNAASLSGFQTSITPDSLPKPAQWMMLILMTAGAMLSWVVGGHLVARALRLPIGVRSIATTSGVLLLATTLIGGIVAKPGDLFPSIFRCLSALFNSGVWLGAAPGAHDRFTLTALLPLAIVGGVGITVLIELWRWPIDRRLSRHAVTTLAAIAGVYIVGGGLLLLSEWFCGAVSIANWREQLAAASALSVNTRSAGLPMELLNTLNRPTQWIAALLMLVGGGSGGAAGGLKVTTIAVLIVGIAQLFRGERPTRVFAIALAWLAAYLFLIGLTCWLLLGLVPEQSADRLLMLAISAVGNVGLSHDVLSAGGNDAYVLSAAMMAGRLLPLLVLWWLGRDTERSEFVVA